MKKVNIIIPVYNASKYIAECLDSILNQTYKNIFLICIDDGSSDNSLDILKSYSSKHDNIMVLSKENGGPSSARNYALDYLNYSKDELLMFVDADDVLKNDFVEKCVSAMTKNNADIVCTSFSFYEDGRSKRCNENYKMNILLDSIDATKQLILDRTIQSHSHCKLYKLKLWNDVRYPLDIVSMEDQATIFKTFIRAKSVYLLENYGYYYRQSDSSICSTQLKTNKGVTDSLLGYYYVCAYDYPGVSSDNKKELVWCAQQALANCYLMMYSRFNKKIASNRQLEDYLKVKKYITKNKVIQKFKPVNKKEKIKKYCYLFLRPFYKMLYKMYIKQ